MSLARLRKMQKAAKERKQDAEQDRLWIEAAHWLWTVLVNDGPNAQHAQDISMTIKYLNNDSVKTEAEKNHTKRCGTVLNGKTRCNGFMVS
jgi:hypothetical protein